jgi:hypothetical protein
VPADVAAARGDTTRCQVVASKLADLLSLMPDSFCPVCNSQVPPHEYDHPHGKLVECSICGTYRLMERGAVLLQMMDLPDPPNVIRTRLSAALRERFERGEEPVLEDPKQLLREYRPAADPLEVIDRIVKHIARKEPGGDKYVPLNGQRDYGIGGAVDAAAFDHALSQAVDMGYIERQAPDEAAYRLRPDGWKRFRELAAPSGGITKIFLSHAALDGELAEVVRGKLTALRPDLQVFVASRPGDIRAEEDWLRAIQRELREADAYCVLLTPNSIERPWVWFETGAAWMSDKRLVLARAAGLAEREVPAPLSTRQPTA